jgi:serine/threonine protein kinase
MSLVFLTKLVKENVATWRDLEAIASHISAGDATLVLKVLNNVKTSDGSDIRFQSRTTHLRREFGSEYEIPTALPPHPGIICVLHWYNGDTTPFVRYLPLLFPPDVIAEAALRMARRTTFLVMPKYKRSLKSWLLELGRPVTEVEWIVILLQLLEVLRVLRANFVAHRDLKADNVFLDGHDRAVIADFGGGIFLRQYPPAHLKLPVTASKKKVFTDKIQAACLNPMAWDPHVTVLNHEIPWDAEGMTLEDVYDKSDLFAVGRMIIDAIVPSAPFPSTSGYYENDKVWFNVCEFRAESKKLMSVCCETFAQIPQLPAPKFSPQFNALVRSLVISHPARRPSAHQAWRRLALLSFTLLTHPGDDVTSPDWLHSARVRLLSGVDTSSDLPLTANFKRILREQQTLYLAEATVESVSEDVGARWL